MRILLVRHGQPDYATDTLTEEGKMQAASAAERLAREPIERIFSSSCGRAVETAAPTAEKFALPIEKLDFMREIGWGPFTEGETSKYPYHPWRLAEALARDGIDPLSQEAAACDAFAGTKAEASLQLICEKSDEWLSSLGYTREGALYRVTRKNDGTVALFAHGGANSCLLSRIFNLPFIFVTGALRFDFTGITEIRLEGEEGDLCTPILRTVNEYAHIGQVGNAVYGR